jgi:FtsP/CotA-like multicopper oxidase with cupredoxin domain
VGVSRLLTRFGLQVLAAALLGAVAAVVIPSASGHSVAAQDDVFVRPLRIPRVLVPGKVSAGDYARCARYRATMRRCLRAAAEQPLVIHMRPAYVSLVPGRGTWWTYDGTFPGPTIRARSGDPIRIRHVNDLPAKAGAMTVHLHGDHHPSSDDGQPADYLIRPGHARTYTYPLTEDGGPERAAFRFYHDHRMGQTGRNVWNGLAGMFILDDHSDSLLPLPKGYRYDIPLMVNDRTFGSENSLGYSSESAPPFDGAIGDHVLVSGTYQPYLNVSDRRYRFRILNASNWCSYNFHLTSDDPSRVPTSSTKTTG